MKNILIVGLKDPAGGVESAVMEQVRNLDKNEVRTDFVVFGQDFSLENEINKLGGKVIYLPSRVKKRSAYKAAVKELFSNVKYDVVWCNFSGLTNIDFLKYAAKTGVPCRIAHAHTSMFAWGNPLMKYLVPIFHYKNQRIVDRFTTHFWACSDVAAEFMFGKKNLSKVSLVKNAIDTKKYIRNEATRIEARREFGIEEEPVIIHVGRMCTAKNQKFLLDIFAKVLEKEPKAKLLFVGDGELHDEVHGYAQQIGLTKNVIFTGTRNDVPGLLQAADAFLLPSLTEGLPVTVIEAQAAGLRCVVSAEAVPKEADVTNNVDFVSLNDSADDWANVVLDATQKHISNGFELVRSNGYDSSLNAKKLQEFFMEVC